MAKSDNLRAAKKNKNDEFYTQYQDIQTEINAYLDYNSNLFKDKIVLCPCDDPEWSNFTKFFAQNFKIFGLKKFISTSYNPGGMGKIFWIDRDVNGDGKIDINDLQWDWLAGDGDFRSQEVTAIRNQVDFVITNPPFSLFREFIDWIWNGPGLNFLVIGNMNAVAYKEIFPKIKNNHMWIGAGGFRAMEHIKPDGSKQKMGNTCWFTNIDHGRRHQPMYLMDIAGNLKHSNHKSIQGKTFEEAYPKYDNYDAIEVSYTDAIPKDYEGVMGVPISFLDKYCPDQFEIIQLCASHGKFPKNIENESCYLNGKWVYARILIRKK